MDILKEHYNDLLHELSLNLPPFRRDAYRAINWARQRYIYPPNTGPSTNQWTDPPAFSYTHPSNNHWIWVSPFNCTCPPPLANTILPGQDLLNVVESRA
ncbi:hypothetical protein NQZ68_012608 [Dissostichus eleginoides]|nr:hypothetical protein NQZ68_012608 [Dissostichus eleginoides]